MKSQRVELIPFPGDGPQPAARLQVDVARQGGRLSLLYVLQGDLEQILLPAPQPAPLRQDRLWETTCFEFFIAPRNSAGYWEFNLSPTGHWNVYAFDDYRRGMRPETAFTAFPFAVRREASAFTLNAQCDLNGLVPDRAPLQLGLSAVIQARTAAVTYWALAHCAPQPDFHRRESYTLAP